MIESYTRRPDRIAVYTGLDFFGSDLDSARTADLVGCAALCLERGEGCRAFTFNADERVVRGPNCFLKSDSRSADGNAVAMSGVMLRRSDPDPAPIVVGAIDPKLGLLKDTDLPGADLTGRPHAKATTAQACRLACVADDTCQAFTWIKDRKQCWLKAAAVNSRFVPGLTSGIKTTMRYVPIKIIPLDR
ncbi:PAN/Apple domain-containing protein [Methylobrevis pamukkalensis]|uniref:PAN domain protein n=1 Tax=Methylobrevis pamukkalensis TaxID=1439726 RepID=A0A1E3GZU6_9HYPH|nr:PAN/Apple domain-containing protein [Methylobrevis pamukkalensis]ODN69086.1 PAN domain protein [Methylobrevis pamukkalensis]